MSGKIFSQPGKEIGHLLKHLVKLHRSLQLVPRLLLLQDQAGSGCRDYCLDVVLLVHLGDIKEGGIEVLYKGTGSLEGDLRLFFGFAERREFAEVPLEGAEYLLCGLMGDGFGMEFLR